MHRHLGAGHCPDLLREVGIAAAVSAICPHISRGLDAVLLEHPMHLAAGHAAMMHEGAGVHCLGPLAQVVDVDLVGGHAASVKRDPASRSSDERRVGTECVSTCRSQGAPY